MKEKELRSLATCAGCQKLIGHTGLPLFYKVTVERFGVDMRVVARQDGLAAFLGSSMLANVMGPQEEMAKEIGDPAKFSICEDCANVSKLSVAALHELNQGVTPR